MNSTLRTSSARQSMAGRRQGGQTIVIAMIILGILLLLGFVFLGIINRNIQNAGRQQSRSVAGDLAQAGIRYAHSQMVNGELGADWRGNPVELEPAGTDVTRDPDVIYLRPGTGLALRNDADSQRDLGGPDGLGPFIRVNFENGRALVRVRYAPGDSNVFSDQPVGLARRPGLVRNYLIIEAVGREGRINRSDPTTLPATGAVRFRNYVNAAAFRNTLAVMRKNEAQVKSSRKETAFVSIGIIESARFIANKYNVTRPAEIGIPRELGAFMGSNEVTVPLQVGSSMPLYTVGPNPSPTPDAIPGNGSIYSNADLMIHGNVQVNLNPYLGDQINVAGSILGADNTSSLQVLSRNVDRVTGLWNPATLTTLVNQPAVGNPSLNSRSAQFDTVGGLVRDGIVRTDPAGYARGVGPKAPPSILTVDPDTNLNRYVVATRESGRRVGGGNAGRFGHGRGVYVDNLSDRQTGTSESSRVNVGTNEALIYDWLNPNNGRAGSGWTGPFYIPTGAYLLLDRAGFTIYRNTHPNQTATERTWRNPDGTDSGNSIIRYRLGRVGAQWYVINSLISSDINAQNPDFSVGLPFNGLLYFEGNVRVRGTIPTDAQLTVISAASIYIEGSIQKGIVDPNGVRLTRPSQSMIALLAKDYVAVNTSMFFGPTPTSTVEAKGDQPSSLGYSPVLVRQPNGTVSLQAEFALDPQSGTANNPSTWTPYAANYTEGGSGNRVTSQLLLTHAADDGPSPTSMFSLAINEGPFDSVTAGYLFPRTNSNAASSLIAGTGPIPVYGLGVDPWQRFAKFEAISFPLVQPNSLTVTADLMTAQVAGGTGSYSFFTQGTNQLTLRNTSVGSTQNGDYVLGRAIVAPHDVRIDATIYAEEGSFFIIPGSWFNPNPNDRRDTYTALGATEPERQLARLETYGAYPGMPFFGEPVDVRVVVNGAVSENMPPPISQQAEWLRKWGWIPAVQGASGVRIPGAHFPAGFNPASDLYVPNFVVTYDPVLATGRADGFALSNEPTDPASPLIRVDEHGRALPPMPRLPVSPKLSYVGEVN